MPLNCFDGTYRSFEQQVLPELDRRGIATPANSVFQPSEVIPPGFPSGHQPSTLNPQS